MGLFARFHRSWESHRRLSVPQRRWCCRQEEWVLWQEPGAVWGVLSGLLLSFHQFFFQAWSPTLPLPLPTSSSSLSSSSSTPGGDGHPTKGFLSAQSLGHLHQHHAGSEGAWGGGECSGLEQKGSQGQRAPRLILFYHESLWEGRCSTPPLPRY